MRNHSWPSAVSATRTNGVTLLSSARHTASDGERREPGIEIHGSLYTPAVVQVDTAGSLGWRATEMILLLPAVNAWHIRLWLLLWCSDFIGKQLSRLTQEMMRDVMLTDSKNSQSLWRQLESLYCKFFPLEGQCSPVRPGRKLSVTVLSLAGSALSLNWPYSWGTTTGTWKQLTCWMKMVSVCGSGGLWAAAAGRM